VTLDELRRVLTMLRDARNDVRRADGSIVVGRPSEARDLLGDVGDVLDDAEKMLQAAWLDGIRKECG
jgi:hypothetical protein